MVGAFTCLFIMVMCGGLRRGGGASSGRYHIPREVPIPDKVVLCGDGRYVCDPLQSIVKDGWGGGGGGCILDYHGNGKQEYRVDIKIAFVLIFPLPSRCCLAMLLIIH